MIWTRASAIKSFLVRILEGALVVAFAVLTLDVLWGVVSRYVLGEQSRWTEELAIYLLIWIALLGAPVAYAEKAHLGVDYLVGKMHPAAQRLAAVSVEVIVGGFATVALVHGGWLLMTKTLAAGQMSPALGIPMGYVYAATPLSGAFFILFIASNLVHLVAARAGEKQARASQSQ